MKTLKQEIFEVLIETGVPAAYRFTDVTVLPRFSYSLIYNGELRLSGKTHTKKPAYQIDYFTKIPADVESFGLFYDVRDALLARNIACRNWQEVEDFNEETGIALFHYYLECER